MRPLELLENGANKVQNYNTCWQLQKKIWEYRNEKTREKVCEANLLCFNITKIQQIYYRLTEMESFPLTYSRMVASYSNYPERFVSNQLSVKETSNTNKRSMHFCDTYRRGRQLYAMASWKKILWNSPWYPSSWKWSR